MDLNKQQSDRLAKLADRDSAAVADVDVQNAVSKTRAAQASLEAAQAALDSANVKLGWTTIRSPVDGYVTNRNVNPGDYAQVGTPLLAVVDEHSYRVEAFFMETQLPRIPVGATARLRLMAGGPTLRGKVAGIARAIYDPQNSSAALIQNPTATFQWIRLAQRIPVEIGLLDVPADFPLVAGATVTVIVEEFGDGAEPGWLHRIGFWMDGLLGWDRQVADG